LTDRVIRCILRAMWDRLAEWKWPWRWAAKVGGFIVVLLLTFFPRLDLAGKYAMRLMDWDRLIDPNLAVMPAINAEIDRRLPAQPSPRQEMAAVQAFVYEKIPYKLDWFNWSNVDYWPTAAEVWARKCEDCDGRAILGASILRARGFTSAHLAGNLSHVWVALDSDDPKAKMVGPRHFAMMNPQKSETFSRQNGHVMLNAPDWDSIRPGFADATRFPAWRAFLALIGGLVLLYHPCKRIGGFGIVLSPALMALCQFYSWGSRMRSGGEAADWELALAAGLIAGAALLAAASNWIFARRRVEPALSLAVPQT
jgi:hypothetical protein